MTPKSTVHFWAIQGFYHNLGPLAGKVQRVGGRWYVGVSADPVVSDIVESIKALVAKVA